MKNRIKLCLQAAWVTGTLAILSTGMNICAATDQACYDAGSRMISTLFVASFPTGIVGVLISLFFLEPASTDQLYDYVIFVLALSCAGYVQWFVLVPKLFAKPKFITLGLEQRTVNAQETTPVVAPLQASKPQRPKCKRVRSIPAYDRHGRTPLERVIALYS